MYHIVIALMLSLAGVVSAQTMTARVKPEEPKEKKELTVDPAMKATVDTLVVKLGDDDRKVRKQAKADLVGLGKVARPHLVPYLKSDDPEVKVAVEEILKEIAFTHARRQDGAEPDDLRKRALLKGYKPQTTGEKKWLNEEMKRLVRLKKREALEAAMAAKRAELEKARAETQKKAAEKKAKAAKKESK